MAEPPPSPDMSRGKVASFLWNLWETTRVFLVGVAIIVPIRAYVVQPFFVRGASMAPSFQDGEYLIIDELSYDIRFRPLQRGDVVVFRYPLDHAQYYIKRVIGLPGERMQIRQGQVAVANAEHRSGVILDETPYLSASEVTEGTVEVTLKSNEVFVLGDNRDQSSDSRHWGPLPVDLVVGRAMVRAFPLRKAGIVSAPWYGALAPGGETARF